jgi:hypothetical protein
MLGEDVSEKEVLIFEEVLPVEWVNLRDFI